MSRIDEAQSAYDDIEEPDEISGFIKAYGEYQDAEIQELILEALTWGVYNYASQSRWDQSEAMLTTLCARFASSPDEETRVEVADTLFEIATTVEDENADYAVRALEKSIDLFSQDKDEDVIYHCVNAHYWLGLTFFEQKDFDKALSVYQKLTEVYQNVDDAHVQDLRARTMINIAGVYDEFGDRAEMIVIYKRLIADYPIEHPHHPEDPFAMAHLCLAEEYLRARKRDNFAEMVTTALELSKGQAEKVVVLRYYAWLDDPSAQNLTTLRTSIEAFNAQSEEDWDITWDISDPSKYLDLSADDQKISNLIRKYLMLELSTAEILEALKG